MRMQLAIAASLLALAACQGETPAESERTASPPPDSGPPADRAEAEGGGSGIPGPTPSPTRSPDSPPPAGSRTESAGGIPTAMHGRWGRTAADCTAESVDATGLMTITPGQLEFYESVGTLEDVTERGTARLRAEFAFSGEGMEWTRREVLQLESGGNALVRRETGDGAETGPVRYMRCE